MTDTSTDPSLRDGNDGEPATVDAAAPDERHAASGAGETPPPAESPKADAGAEPETADEADADRAGEPRPTDEAPQDAEAAEAQQVATTGAAPQDAEAAEAQQVATTDEAPQDAEAAEAQHVATTDEARGTDGDDASPDAGARFEGPAPGVLGQPHDRPCSVELPQFEGPLDLLLHLVRRHELDILDIPISFVCEKYLEYLAFMQSLDLEVAGDYLVMAATLAYLKSRELIPTAGKDDEQSEGEAEEGPDPRQELIARLLEYQKYRAAADHLDRLPVSGRDVFDRGGEVELPLVDPGLAPITMFRLAEAYQRILKRAKIHKSHEVVLETVSVPQRMQQLAALLEETETFDFESLFLGRTWSSEAELRAMLVVTLMSVLELTKLGVIFVRQEPEGDTIVIERRTSPAETQKLLAAYQGEVGAAVEAMRAADAESEDHV